MSEIKVLLIKIEKKIIVDGVLNVRDDAIYPYIWSDIVSVKKLPARFEPFQPIDMSRAYTCLQVIEKPEFKDEMPQEVGAVIYCRYDAS